LFAEIFGALQTDCGYTPAEINEMTMLDVQRLANHWRQSPPMRVLMRLALAALDVKLPEPSNPAEKKYMTAEQFGALLAATDGLKVG